VSLLLRRFASAVVPTGGLGFDTLSAPSLDDTRVELEPFPVASALLSALMLFGAARLATRWRATAA
jgi:hypothetical protein